MKLTDYISGDRRGRAARDLEAEALRDPFLAEAIEGLEPCGAEFASLSADLRRRIARRAFSAVRRRRLRVAATAAAVLLVVGAGSFAWLYAPPGDIAVEAPLPVGLVHTGRPSPAGPDSLETGTEAGTEAERMAAPSAVVAHVPIAAPAVAPPPAVVAGPQRQVVVESDGPKDWVEDPEPDDDPSSGDPIDAEAWGDASVDKEGSGNATVRAYGAEHRSGMTGAVGTGGAAAGEMRIRGTRRLPSSVPGEVPADSIRPASAAKAPADSADGQDRPFAGPTSARFRGGDLGEFRKWVQKRVRKPEAMLACGVPGRLIVSFVIDTLGDVGDIRLLQVPDRALADEAVRVLQTSPRWEPARQGDRKVPQKFIMPVDFD